jgi:uncharacterized protein YbcV (DUF1398 family)
MNTATDMLLAAQQRAMETRPAVGGFPHLAEVLKQAGVEKNIWSLPSCQSVYIMQQGNVVMQGTPLVTGTHDIPAFDRDALILCIQKDQAGDSTFPAFLQAAWEAGVISYTVDFITHTVSYYGARGEEYVEEYPVVALDV